MISTKRVTQIVLTIGLTTAGGATCFAQSDAPIIIQERPQEARDRAVFADQLIQV